jgi:hypothetical protein
MQRFFYTFFAFFLLTLPLVAQEIETENPFGIKAKEDDSMLFMFFGLIVIAVALVLMRDTFSSVFSKAVEYNDGVAEQRKEKIREAKERKEAEREAKNATRAAEAERRLKEAEAALAAAEAKNKTLAEKNKRKNEIKALDTPTDEEAEIMELMSDDLITKSIKGKHLIERLRRDVGLPNHTEDSDMATAGKMYKYGNGKQVFIQITDLNAAKIEAKILADALAAQAKARTEAEKAYRRKVKIVAVVVFAILFCVFFFTFIEKI